MPTGALYMYVVDQYGDEIGEPVWRQFNYGDTEHELSALSESMAYQLYEDVVLELEK